MTTSIVMATYNGEKYIEEQIKSLMNQTVLPDEIVICDDCSNDLTLYKIEKVLKESEIYHKIIHHEKNMGVIQSFFDGIQNASGDIIFFCDQDDFWYENKIESFMREFEKDEKYLVVLSNADIVNQDLSKRGKTLWESIRYSGGSDLLQEMLKRNIFTGMCMAVQRELVINNLNFSSNMLHDEYIGWLSLFSGKVKILNQVLAKYRQHGNNVIGSSRRKKFTSIGSMQNQIKASSLETREKFRDLLKILDDTYYYRNIEEALSFYEYRVSIFYERKIKSFFIFLKKVIAGDYQRYTSETEHAKLKDFLCIMLKR